MGAASGPFAVEHRCAFVAHAIGIADCQASTEAVPTLNWG